MLYGIGEFHIRDVGQRKSGNATTFGILNYLENTRNIINMFLQTSIIILHEENTQKIMAVKGVCISDRKPYSFT